MGHKENACFLITRLLSLTHAITEIEGDVDWSISNGARRELRPGN